MKPARVRNPIRPGSKTDRTGAAGILRRCVAQINRRWAGLLAEVLAIFERIPRYTANDAAADFGRVIYGLTPQELAATAQALQDALDRWVTEGREAKHVLWYEPFQAEAAQLGSAQSAANLGQLSETYAATRSLRDIVFSEAYRNRVAMAQIKSYEHWTGLTQGMRSELSQIIGRAVVDGKAPKAVRKEIMERLDVSKSKALQYAQTDITDTLRQARMAEADQAAADFGLAIGLLWTSALIPTTRASHAAKHGKILTSSQVHAFYEVNGNRYGCHCSVTEVLLDSEGQAILTDSLKAGMSKEKKTWSDGRPS